MVKSLAVVVCVAFLYKTSVEVSVSFFLFTPLLQCYHFLIIQVDPPQSIQSVNLINTSLVPFWHLVRESSLSEYLIFGCYMIDIIQYPNLNHKKNIHKATYSQIGWVKPWHYLLPNKHCNLFLYLILHLILSANYITLHLELRLKFSWSLQVCSYTISYFISISQWPSSYISLCLSHLSSHHISHLTLHLEFRLMCFMVLSDHLHSLNHIQICVAKIIKLPSILTIGTSDVYWLLELENFRCPSCNKKAWFCVLWIWVQQIHNFLVYTTNIIYF